MKLGMEYVLRFFLIRFFGTLWIVLAWLGLKSEEEVSTQTAEDQEMETVYIDEDDVEEVHDTAADSPSDETIPRTPVADAVDGEKGEHEGVAEVAHDDAGAASKHLALVPQPACFSFDVLNQAVAMLVRLPLVEGKSVESKFTITFDGRLVQDFNTKMLPIPSKSDSAIHLVTLDGSALGGKVELSVN